MIQKIIQKVRGFSELPTGWYFGEGVPPSRDILDTALSLLLKADELGFDNADAFPGASGEIQIAVYRDDDNYEFTVEHNGVITFSHDENEREIYYENNLSLEEALSTLTRISERLWPSLDYFTTNITLRIVDDLVASHLRTQVTGRASPLLTANAQNVLAGQFVRISPHSTLMSLASRSSIGKFQSARFLEGAIFSKGIVHPATDVTSTFKAGPIRMPNELLNHCQYPTTDY